MEPTTTAASIGNNQFLFACHYITTLGIIFNKNNLISSAVENSTLPVLNAFFEYLNKSTNETAAKIHLFNEIQSEFNISDFDKSFNLKDVNKLYDYIINMALFANYGNITGYVGNIITKNDNNKSFSNVRELLFRNFSKNFITKDICSNDSSKLNSLTTERIFADFILPVFTKMWKYLNTQVNDLKIVKRFTRQVSSSEQQDKNVEMNEASEEEVLMRNFRHEFLSKLKTYGLTILNQKRDLFCKMIKSLAIEQMNNREHYSLELWLEEHSTKSLLRHFLCIVRGSTFFFNDFKLLTRNQSGHVPPKMWKLHTPSDEVQIVYHITSDSLNGFVDFDQNVADKNLYVLFPKVLFTVTTMRYEENVGKGFLFIDLRRNDLSSDAWYDIVINTKHGVLSNKRNSKRMHVIERIAKYLSSVVPMKSFNEAVNMLKSYILPVDTVNPNSLTYDQLAERDSNLININSYLPMRIYNNKYINDVLYESKFYFHHNIGQYYWEFKRILKLKTPDFLEYYYNKYRRHLNYLETKIRFEDFFRINSADQSHLQRIVNDFRVTLLRVALRQCDEEFNQEPIVLYQAFSVSHVSSSINKYTKKIIKLNLKESCSENPDLVLNNILNDATTKTMEIIIFFKIKLKNRCGIAEIGEFNRNERNSHFLTVDEKYKRIEKSEDIIAGRNIIYMSVEPIDEMMTKEEKMINIANQLNILYRKKTTYFI